MWSGSYGGALFLKGNNSTTDRYAELTTVDSSGAKSGDGLIVKGAGSSINVGIGEDSPDSRLGILETPATIVGGNAINGSTMKGIKLKTNLNGAESVGVWFGTNGNHWSGVSGQRSNSASTWGTDLRFYTHEDASNDLTYSRERLRIDSSGNVLVGKTSTGDYVTGIEFQPAGAVLAYRTGAVAGIFGRSDDGEIIRLTMNGAIKGRIGTRASDPWIARSGGCGVRYITSAWMPTNDTGADNDNAVDLGTSSNRFKDAHFSGTVNAGDLVVSGSAKITMAGGGLQVHNNGTAGYNANIFFGIPNQTDGWSIGQGITANDGKFRVYDNAAGAVRMTVDSSGNVGIGVTPTEQLQVGGRAAAVLDLASTSNTGSSRINFSDTALAVGQILYDHNIDAMQFKVGGPERMRIDSSGNVLVGVTAGSYGSRITASSASSYTFESRRTGTGNEGHIVFQNGNGAVGSIFTNGSATSYNTSSDYRLKEDLQPMTGAADRVQALNPVNFAWKVDGTRVDGFLAHEAQAVVPEAVTGTKDAMRDEEYEVSAALGEVFTPAIDGIDEVTETVVVTQAVEAQDAVTGERQVMETIETGTYVNLAGETITETQEVGITEEATETVIERQATALGEVFTASVEGVDEVAETIIVTQAIEAQSEVTETVVITQAIAAQDAVMSERQVMETIETGTYVNLAGETIIETREVRITEEATETVVERQDIDGIMTEVEVERTVQVAVMEEYEVSPAIEAVAEVTEQRIITESVEAVAEVTEQRIITESVEAVAEVVLETDVERPAELEEDQQWREMTAGVMTEVEVERTIQVAVMEAYEVTPAIEAVTEVTEVNVITESVEAIAEVVLETDVERPTELADQQQWRETAEQVMATREVPEMQGIDQGKIVPLLTAALQEALARIEALEATQ
jgi:hypothetical protein